MIEAVLRHRDEKSLALIAPAQGAQLTYAELVPGWTGGRAAERRRSGNAGWYSWHPARTSRL